MTCAYRLYMDSGDGTTEPADQTQWAEPSHDARGNMMTVPLADSPATPMTCIYDAWNRLAKVTIGGITVAEYEYDGLNRRIVRAYDSAAPANPNGLDAYQHLYYNAGWQVMETRQAASASAQPETLDPQYQYAWSVRYIDAAVLRDENRNGDGDCTDADDQRLYYANDANMNVTALFGTDGDVVERYGYDPYGAASVLDADWAADGDGGSDYANAYLFQGRRLDGETDLYYFRNRMYSAAIGRFVQRDPLEYADVINLYEFARTNPPCHRDATGQVSTRAWRHIRRIRLSINQFGRHVGETQEACLKRAAKLIAQWRKNSKELLETSLQDIRHRARLLQAYEREREILEKMTEVTGISTALHVTHRVLHRRHLKLLSAGHVKAAKGAGKAAKGIMAIHVALLGVDAVNAWRLGLDFGGIELTGVQRETARTTLENFKLRVRFAQDFGKKAPGICCRRTDVASAGCHASDGIGQSGFAD